MPSFLEKIIWLLKKAAGSAKDHAEDSVAFYIENPGDIPGDLWGWIKRNKLTCCLIVGGVLVIVVPLAIGFGPAGPILGSIAAGWQSGIGSVAAGSLFATLQSLAMTGVFTSIGATMIGGGVLKFLGDFAWNSLGASFPTLGRLTKEGEPLGILGALKHLITRSWTKEEEEGEEIREEEDEEEDTDVKMFKKRHIRRKEVVGRIWVERWKNMLIKEREREARERAIRWEEIARSVTEEDSAKEKRGGWGCWRYVSGMTVEEIVEGAEGIEAVDRLFWASEFWGGEIIVEEDSVRLKGIGWAW